MELELHLKSAPEVDWKAASKPFSSATTAKPSSPGWLHEMSLPLICRRGISAALSLAMSRDLVSKSESTMWFADESGNERRIPLAARWAIAPCADDRACPDL